jgi:WXG100 family type VII secretion target
MSTIGAEMGQLQELKSTFDRESATVEQLTRSIDGKVQGTWWKGPAADRFRNQWESEFKPNLANLRSALQEASSEVGRRHEALQQAGS